MGLLQSIGLAPPRTPQPAAKGAFEITGVTVINPGRARTAAATVSIAGGKVAQVAAADDARAASPYANCYVLPGLIDMHVHLPPGNALPLTCHAALMYLAHGVTTIREAGDLDGTSVQSARRLAADAAPCPRVVSCGPFVGAGKPTFRNTLTLRSADAAEADEAARRVKATGASFMKFYDGLTEPMIRQLEAACDRHGLRIMGHVPAELSYETARIREVQHFFGVPLPESLERPALVNRSCDWHAVDERRMDEIAAFSIAGGIANTPTIVTNHAMLSYLDYPAACRRQGMRRIAPFYPDVVWHPEHGGLNSRLPPDYLTRQVRPAIKKKQQLTRKLFDNGAELFLGTDVAQPFLLPGESLQQEMTLFAEAGIPPEAVWQLATHAAGKRLGILQLGTIEAGAPADLLIFRKDPTQSLDDLDSLIAVVVAGELYDASELERTLEEFGAYFRSPIVKPLAARGARQAMARVLRR
ncbi:amidohydrolase family protein [Bradyrhizobium diazoefficiens]|nr:amidohydrolase family protein [Bradyrhizobium diazoefficiens]MBR0775392.1 amidohydrolase family protein [Bradyrhizobium diazoefficiens]